MTKARMRGTHKPDPRFYERARDAETGHFVTLEYARANPRTTIVERVKRPPHKLN